MKKITAKDLNKKIEAKDGTLVIDVLPNKYHAQAHIPASINIPLDSPDFTDKVLNAAGSKDRAIVVYCWKTDCDLSAKAYEQLEAAGFKNVTKFAEGTMGWKDAGFKAYGSDCGCGAETSCSTKAA